ncbi:MAG: M23 family metallopeptidase [Edaphobacter sp.]|uniref:M23 family metallopeptidase n=1 Tax=Edaphobacter sp. TaxID=1934404 RepID=UPI00131C5B85|nr:peptidoglycan DD-metalloendopeptidase family protein [Edaphobacter sp.]MDW5264168.1 M23 family metallopeptidase [Edaphobacter sp.]
MRARRLLFASVLPLLLVMMALPALSEDAFTPVIASALRPATFAVLGTDNKLHLVYELVITNTGSAPATIEKIDVVSGDASAKVVASFEGDALHARLRATGRGEEAVSPIESSGSRLFLVDFTMDKDSHPPATLLHRFHLMAAGPPGSPKGETVPYTDTMAPISVGTDVTVLGPPLEGKGWVAFNGCCEPTGIHRGSALSVNGQIYFAQRFAIDWMLLYPDAKVFHGDGKSVKDYAGYGVKVIAVADGTVVDTLANLDNQIPGILPDPKSITIKNVDGNHIVLDLGHGKYAFYAHLQKDSLLVSMGDHVKRGQVLALLGNTGNTSAPHLHFHLMDGASVLGSSGLPYVIDHFAVAGQLPAAQFNASGIDGEWSKDLSAHPSSKKSEFPLDLTVVDF